jgi:hypothetical protein
VEIALANMVSREAAFKRWECQGSEIGEGSYEEDYRGRCEVHGLKLKDRKIKENIEELAIEICSDRILFEKSKWWKGGNSIWALNQRY